MTIFYCQKFDAVPSCRARSQEYIGPVITPPPLRALGLVSQSSQSQSYVTTDGQSASLSYCQARITFRQLGLVDVGCTPDWRTLNFEIVKYVPESRGARTRE
jgi:hypothetical protein